jgi:hypothetical protein
MPRPHGPNLVAWLGRADLNAITRADEVGVGPICQAVTARSFARVDLLSNFSAQEAADYLAWLRPRPRPTSTSTWSRSPARPPGRRSTTPPSRSSTHSLAARAPA